MVKAICSGYILFLVGLAAGSVGDMPTTTGEPYPLMLPFLMGAILLVPAFLGYAAGREDALKSRATMTPNA